MVHGSSIEMMENKQYEVLHPERPCGNANDIGQKNGLSSGDIRQLMKYI